MNQRECVLTCCAICKIETSRRCSRCLEVYYCNREHQREDWKRHKSECLPKLPEVKTHKDKANSPFVENSHISASVDPHTSAGLQSQRCCANESKEKLRKHKKKLSDDTGAPDKSDCKQSPQTRISSNNTATIASKHGVDKLADLSLFQDSIVKSKLVYSREVSNENTITNEGSSEKEILSESAQQLNGLDFAKAVTDNVLKNLDPLNDSLQAMPAYVSPTTTKVVPKEYPEDSLKSSLLPANYLTDTSDPSYEICQRVIRDMTQYGVCVLDNFLGKDRGLLVLNEVLDMYRSGIFTAGQLVSNPGSTEAQTIRSDRIAWLDGKEPHCNNIGVLINYVDSIVLRANKMANNGKMGDYIINGRTKAMVACYPGSGSHYVKHVDNPNKDGRCITAIYYLNLDWDVNKTGGLLRVFPEGTETVANIQPIFDRMLFFWSDRRNPHEVQPAFATRYAITLWYFDSHEREEALRLYKSRANQPSSSK